MSYEIQPINPTNIKKVTDLDDRPNITGEYGKSALTAKELKERFDSYANEVRLKVEEILKAFSSTVTTETTDDGPIAVAGNGNYIALDLDDDPNDKKQAKLGESLADLVASFFTGAFAARLMVDLGEDEESDNLHSLLSILNAHIDKFSKLEEEKFDKHYNEEREIYENQIVTEQIKDGAVTHDKLGKDLTDSLSSLEGNKIKSVRTTDSHMFTIQLVNDSGWSVPLGYFVYSGSITEEKIANYAVTENKIKDGAVTLDKLHTDVKQAVQGSFSNVSYDAATGKLTFVNNNAQETEIDLPLELLVKSGSYDAKTKDITLILANGDSIKISLDDITDTLSSSIEDVKNAKFDKFLNADGTYENQIVTEQIKDGAVTSDKIAENTITGNNIAENTITGNNIAYHCLNDDYIENRGISGNSIKRYTIDDTNIVPYGITGSSISGSTIQDHHLASSVTRYFDMLTEDRKRIETLEGLTLATIEDSTIAYEKVVPADVGKYAVINRVGGFCVKEHLNNNLCSADGVYEVSGDVYTIDLGYYVSEHEDFFISLEGDLSGSYLFELRSEGTGVAILHASDIDKNEIYVGLYDNFTGHIYLDIVRDGEYGPSGTITGIMMCSETDPDKTYKPYQAVLKSVKPARIESLGANLIPYPYVNTTLTKNGITFTDNGDGSITISGTATGDAILMLQHNCDYGTSNLSAMAVDTATNGLYSISKRLFYNGSNKTLSVNIAKGYTVNETIYPMVNKGATLAPYKPYSAKPITNIVIREYIRNLPGYGIGKSATECNYIDFDTKYYIEGYEIVEGEVQAKDVPKYHGQVIDYLQGYEDFLFIEVEPGGALRFVNEDGTETPIPSTVTYQKKL